MQGIEADGEAMEARVPQGGRLVGEQHAVGGQRQIADGGLLRQPPDQVRQVLAEQRLAPGQPDAVGAGVGEGVDENADLLEGQDVPALGARRTPPPACSTGSAGCSGR